MGTLSWYRLEEDAERNVPYYITKQGQSGNLSNEFIVDKVLEVAKKYYAWSMINYLIDGGFLDHQKDDYFREDSFLGWAIMGDYDHLVSDTILKGFDPSTHPNHHQQPALLFALAKGKFKAADAILSSGKVNSTSLQYKFADGNPYHLLAKWPTYSEDINKVFEHLIKLGYWDINAKDNKGVTPLHYACGYGYRKLVKYYLKEGAEVYAKTPTGETPLDWSYRRTHGNHYVLRLLSKYYRIEGYSKKQDFDGEE